MKRNFISALIVVTMAAGICWLLKKNSRQDSAPSVSTNEAAVMTNVPASLAALTNSSPQIIVRQTNESLPINKPADEIILSNYQTLDDLKQIKTLQNVGNYLKYRDWYSENNLVTFQLKNVSGGLAGFTADAMWALTDKKDDHVHQLVLLSPWLDIDGVRKVGLELEKTWGLNPTDFLAWCDKVGNKWVDAPLYSAGNGFPPAPEPYIGFSVRRTTNDEKPWVIVLTIQDKR